ncbi:MAG: glycosyltransferase [Candidatus Magnetominusculus sp. LBB02]|nr:glycosyltransferase [Candidatus Magnetominusculus sp. LBB02]
MRKQISDSSRHRVLHLITGMEVGGAENMLLRLAPCMEEAFENRVCVIQGRGPLAARLEAAGAAVTYLDLKSMFDLRPILRFRRLVKEFKPDIVVTYLIHADLFGRIFGRAFGIRKIVCYQRGALLNWEFLRKVDRLTTALVSKYIVQTETAKEELAATLNIAKQKIAVVGNAVDLETFNFHIDTAAKKRELGLNPDNKNIVCVGNLREGKGHLYLLEGFEALFRDFPRVNLLIVGDGQRKKDLLSQAGSFTSKANIHFLGNRDDVLEILKISDIFVLPTLYEGMSNAIMEAMASKVVVITTDIAVNAELTGGTAVLVTVKNAGAITMAMRMLLEDDALRNDFVERAYDKVSSQYSLDIIVQKYTALLKEVIDG